MAKKPGYRKVNTSYGTYYYEKIQKIPCGKCGRMISKSRGYNTRCRSCGYTTVSMY